MPELHICNALNKKNESSSIGAGRAPHARVRGAGAGGPESTRKKRKKKTKIVQAAPRTREYVARVLVALSPGFAAGCDFSAAVPPLIESLVVARRRGGRFGLEYKNK